MSRVLIVEDEEAIADLEKDYLELSGFTVEIENNGTAGLKRALSEEFDMFILDLMLPGTDGFEICKKIREEKNTPILMVSAKKDDIDKIRGLGLGADDYITKPFSPSELVARVKAHLARYERLIGSSEAKNDIIEIRGIRIDKTARRVWVNDEEKQFTTKEFDLLTFLASHPNHVYTKEELNSFSRETLMAVILSMQDQIHQLNTNMERLIEQIADANNKRYGRSSEKLETISGQMELELIFNEAEALTETLYVVEPVEEEVIQPRRKNKGKREADLKDLPIEVIVHTLSEEKLQDVFGTDGWKQLPDEIYKRVRVQPAVYTVEEHHVAVYAGKDNQTIIKADHPEEFLKDFKGIVVCDGYSAYRKLDRENPDIVFAGCWSHARRRFAEALKALPKAAQKNAKETVAYEAVSRIAAIYHLDNQMEGQPAKVRKMYRQANIRPLVEAFFAWAKEIQIKNQLSRGKTLDGINYCINQEVSLKAFLEDGDIPMDNNATESALRSFCLHKHTWKLIDSLDGANASAIIYSITETAKANNLNPFRYLEHVLTVLKDHQDDREYSFIDDILPWSEKLPAICRSKTKATNI